MTLVAINVESTNTFSGIFFDMEMNSPCYEMKLNAERQIKVNILLAGKISIMHQRCSLHCLSQVRGDVVDETRFLLS